MAELSGFPGGLWWNRMKGARVLVIGGMAVTKATRAVLLAAALVASACTGTPDEGTKRPPGDAAEVKQQPTVNVAQCDSAIEGNADSRWRERSTVVGNVGFYGPGRDFRAALDTRGDLITKMPIIIEGDSGAIVWIPRQERDRVALLFGKIRHKGPYEIGDGYARVRFEPCTDRERTGFVGGLVLRDRQPVTLKVRLQGTHRMRSVRLGRLPAKER
jgi:hypothetical protein